MACSRPFSWSSPPPSLPPNTDWTQFLASDWTDSPDHPPVRLANRPVDRSERHEGLLDELTLMISPVVAGGGRKRLFAADAALTSLELVEAQSTSGGTLIATYRPSR
jgi:hypothetical protein